MMEGRGRKKGNKGGYQRVNEGRTKRGEKRKRKERK